MRAKPTKKSSNESQGVRLQKLLSDAGIASRRACEELILSGRVCVNGVTVKKLGTKADLSSDKITVDSVPIRVPQKVLYVFHKPRGVITAMSDPEGRACVGDYVANLARRVYPIGRLDYNVSGLLLLTNDGDYAQKLSHPQYAIQRKYLARVKGELTKNRARVLVKGVAVKTKSGSDSEKAKKPAFGKLLSVEVVAESKYSKDLVGELKEAETLLEVVATEGRNHFIKNILDTVGLPVNKLSRIEFGPYKLGNLKSGFIREVALKKDL